MKWYKINECELMSFHMAAALQLGRNKEAQDVVDQIRKRETTAPEAREE